MSDKVIATAVTNDDVAVEKSSYSTGRRGVAGTLIVEKIVGAAAEEGRDLEPNDIDPVPRARRRGVSPAPGAAA